MAYADQGAVLRVGQAMTRFSLHQGDLQALLGTAAKLSSAEAQDRLTDMLSVIDSVRGWTRDDGEALEWYRAEPIPAFGNRTAAELVRLRMTSTVRDYIEHISLGGYA